MSFQRKGKRYPKEKKEDMTPSARNEFERRDGACGRGESLHPLSRGLRIVFLAISRRHRVAHASAAYEFRSHRYFEPRGLNRPARFLSEGPEPSRRLVVPRPDEQPTFNDYGPNARVPMFDTRAHTKDLGRAQRFDDIISEPGILR